MKYQTPRMQRVGVASDLVQMKNINGGDNINQSLHTGIPVALEAEE